jgi:hypothetical protein
LHGELSPEGRHIIVVVVVDSVVIVVVVDSPTQVAAVAVLPVGQLSEAISLSQRASQALEQLEEVQSSTMSFGEAHTVPAGAVQVHVHIAPHVFGVPP